MQMATVKISAGMLFESGAHDNGWSFEMFIPYGAIRFGKMFRIGGKHDVAVKKGRQLRGILLTQRHGV
jgi:hypothetical protein